MIPDFGPVGMPQGNLTTCNDITQIVAFQPAVLTGLDVTTTGGPQPTLGSDVGNSNVIYDAAWGSIVRIFGGYRKIELQYSPWNRGGGKPGGPIGFVPTTDDQPFEINIPYNQNVAFLSITSTAKAITSIGVAIVVAANPRKPRVGPYKMGPFGVSTAAGVFFDQSYGMRNSTLQNVLVYQNASGINSIGAFHSNVPLYEIYFANPGNAVEIPEIPAVLATDPIASISGECIAGIIGVWPPN